MLAAEALSAREGGYAPDFTAVTREQARCIRLTARDFAALGKGDQSGTSSPAVTGGLSRKGSLLTGLSVDSDAIQEPAGVSANVGAATLKAPSIASAPPVEHAELHKALAAPEAEAGLRVKFVPAQAPRGDRTKIKPVG